MNRATPRRHGSGFIGVVISLGCPLHPLLARYGSMWSPLVHEVERFSGCFSPLVHRFKSQQGRALICRMVFFTDKTHFYRVQWTFFLRMLSGAPGTKDGQIPLCFLLLLLDSQGTHLHGNGLSHLTFEVFHLNSFLRNEIDKGVLAKSLLPLPLFLAALKWFLNTFFMSS